MQSVNRPWYLRSATRMRRWYGENGQSNRFTLFFPQLVEYSTDVGIEQGAGDT